MNAISQSFPIPLSFTAHQLAEHHRQQQKHPQKAKQAYLNTLAVFAVNQWLQCLGFETEMEKSDIYQPFVAQFMNTADLIVKRIGRLECRAILPDSEVCHIPLEAWDDRVGYIAIQLDPSLKCAEIIGFVTTPAEVIPLKQLQSPEELIEFLSHKLEPEVTLHQWLVGKIEPGWKTLEQLLNPEQLELTLSFRRQIEVRQGQQIDLGMHIDSRAIALVLSISTETETEMAISVQVHPINQSYLSPGINLMISDDSGTQLSVTAREADNFIQKEFVAAIGDCFNITISIDETSVTKNFIV
jgi:hypothetical protein